ncbi:hypothetical protein MLD38_014762 [Melastoma candidum]|uniref:Uncharacterized protein n=1 Tax=Melastoma candidum TaxID=119954 RepID=A0ACB9RGX5_9MYRT|nr:hypothetical protein MLD38_014762 [Melastoma candidum]
MGGRSGSPLVLLFFAASFFLMLPDHCGGSAIGVCYGRNADDLPTPDKVAQLIQQHNIKFLRIYDSNIQVLKAFANTDVEIMIGIPNLDLLAFSQFQSNADTWLKNSILPYYPATKIAYITVGAEATESPGNVSSLVVPAMQNVFNALRKVGLHKRIKVSTTHSLGVLSRSFPPSAGAFNSNYASFLKPLLIFLADNQSPFMIDIYPYYAYYDSHGNVSLDYALFESSSEVIDPNTGLLYANMFDAQIDALNFALTALNFQTVKVMVTETGWPSKGSRKEAAATPDNAQTYNTNLIRHVINNTGTPAKPGDAIDVYLFSLFNENRKPGMESERNWGLFYPDQTSVYNLDFTGRGSVDVITGANVTSLNGTTWCIASSNSSDSDLQSAVELGLRSWERGLFLYSAKSAVLRTRYAGLSCIICLQQLLPAEWCDGHRLQVRRCRDHCRQEPKLRQLPLFDGRGQQNCDQQHYGNHVNDIFIRCK